MYILYLENTLTLCHEPSRMTNNYYHVDLATILNYFLRNVNNMLCIKILFA